MCCRQLLVRDHDRAAGLGQGGDRAGGAFQGRLADAGGETGPQASVGQQADQFGGLAQRLIDGQLGLEEFLRDIGGDFLAFRPRVSLRAEVSARRNGYGCDGIPA